MVRMMFWDFYDYMKPKLTNVKNSFLESIVFHDKEIRDKIDGLTTKQDEREDSPTPIPQQHAQTNESGQNQKGRSPNNRNSSPT